MLTLFATTTQKTETQCCLNKIAISNHAKVSFSCLNHVNLVPAVQQSQTYNYTYCIIKIISCCENTLPILTTSPNKTHGSTHQTHQHHSTKLFFSSILKVSHFQQSLFLHSICRSNKIACLKCKVFTFPAFLSQPGANDMHYFPAQTAQSYNHIHRPSINPRITNLNTKIIEWTLMSSHFSDLFSPGHHMQLEWSCHLFLFKSYSNSWTSHSQPHPTRQKMT